MMLQCVCVCVDVVLAMRMELTPEKAVDDGRTVILRDDMGTSAKQMKRAKKHFMNRWPAS